MLVLRTHYINFYTVDSINLTSKAKISILKYYIFLFVSGLLFSCTTEIEQDYFDTTSYYYPYHKLGSPKVYEYQIEHNGAQFVSHYWEFQTIEEAGNVYLLCKRYNPQFEIDQSVKELILEEGVVTTAYDFHVKDTNTQELVIYPNRVSQNIVFPFKASLDTIMAYRFVCEMKLPPDFLNAKLVRDRKFGQPLKYQLFGDTIEAVSFINTDLYDIQNVEEGGYWTVKKGLIEIYAKGIGLVYQEERTAGQEGVEITKLTAIYTEKEFEKLKKNGNNG